VYKRQAGNLLGREWAVDRQMHEAQAQKALADAVARLRAGGKAAAAEEVQAAIAREKRRDLVVELLWTDQADVDLEVTEPTGAVCSPRQRQTTGGGVWRGDILLATDRAEKYAETYTAGEAFPGTYAVRAKRVWGEPLGNKVTVRVTRHQGTPQQTQELHRLTFGPDGTAEVMVYLADGRRTDLAAVPPPAPPRSAAPAAAGNPDRVYNLLRAMAEPAYSGRSKAGMQGGTSADGPAAGQVADVAPDLGGAAVIHQNRLDTGLRTGAEVMGQAVIDSKRQSLTVSLAPVFQTATAEPDVKLSAIPGGN
jgi:hypothetical protein